VLARGLASQPLGNYAGGILTAVEKLLGWCIVSVEMACGV
jgi:hypothetical protein